MATFDYQAAKDEGYTDEEIQNFLAANPDIQVADKSTDNPVLDFLQGAANMLAPNTTRALTSGVSQIQQNAAARPNAKGNLGQAASNAAAQTLDMAKNTLNPRQLAETASFAIPGAEVEGAAGKILGKALPGTIGDMAGKIAAKAAPGTVSGALQGASTGNPQNIGPDALLGNLGTLLRGAQHPIAPLGKEVDSILAKNPATLNLQDLKTAFQNGPLQDLYKRGYGDQATQAGNDVFSSLRQAMDSYNRGKAVVPEASGGSPFVPNDAAASTLRGTPIGQRYVRDANGQLVPMPGDTTAPSNYALDTSGSAPYQQQPQLDTGQLDNLSLPNANSYKRNLYRTASESYGGDTGRAGTEAQKGLAGILKGAIEQQAPGVAPYNALMSLLYRAPNAAHAVVQASPKLAQLVEKVATTPALWAFQHLPTQNPLSRFLLQYGPPGANNQAQQ